MKANTDTTTRINLDNDVFAYRSQATRLRSEAVRRAFRSMLDQTRAQFFRGADKPCHAAECR